MALASLGRQINLLKDSIHDHSASNKSSPDTPKCLQLQDLPVRPRTFKFIEETRLLGIVVDNGLSWSAQVASVYSKVGRKIGALE